MCCFLLQIHSIILYAKQHIMTEIYIMSWLRISAFILQFTNENLIKSLAAKVFYLELTLTTQQL